MIHTSHACIRTLYILHMNVWTLVFAKFFFEKKKKNRTGKNAVQVALKNSIILLYTCTMGPQIIHT